jgi:hypothetical protein
MIIDESDSKTVLDKATEAVRNAAEAVQSTTETFAGAIEEDRRTGGIFHQLVRFTRQAPLRSLAVAFTIGLVVARRR